MEIKKETKYLEVTDTIRSESLQIRRHEKNFFLYPLLAKAEAEVIQTYIGRLNTTFIENAQLEKSGEFARVKNLINDYGKRMDRIKQLLEDAWILFGQLQRAHAVYSNFFPLIETSFYDQPLKAAELLEKAFSLPQTHPLIRTLEDLEAEIGALRKVGEDLISASRDLDKVARSEVDDLISILIIFLLLFFISAPWPVLAVR